MTEVSKNLVRGIQTFEKIIENDLLYVDKTTYLADMISDKGVGIWFLSRPRRFGKSLTVSTLEAVFKKRDSERDKPLFKGLAIESRLGEEAFAPRPVIKLDMSDVATNMGPEEVEFSLRRLLVDKAQEFGFNMAPEIPSGEMFRRLIKELASKSGKVAVLIDEYDNPLTSFFGDPGAIETVRRTMRAFFSNLKSMDEHISFAFITGVCKFTRVGVFSALNNLRDISLNPKFGAMLGYTHEEFASNFAGHVKAAAAELKMSEERFLEEARSYYDGFCFDGQTRVYNPFSASLLLDDKVFLNFWFDTGSSSFINRYLRENRLTVEEFRGLRVGKGFAAEPGEIDQAEPASFLYQSGYLTLRPGDAEGKFVLDYPNREVLEAMSGLMMDYILGGRQHYEAIVYDLKKALDVVDTGAVVDTLNLVLSSLLYDDQIAALKMGRRLLVPEEAMGEWLYRSTILTFLRTADFSIAAEVHGNAGRSDLELANGERVWVFELKVPTTGQSDEDAAKAALAQINEKNYAGRHRKPLLMGLAVSKIKRIITAWTSQDGLSPENRPKQVFPETDPEPAPRPPRPRM